MVHSSSKRVKSNKGKGKSSSTTSSSGRPAKIRKVKEVVFDPDARKEFLTGFSKRKQARKLAVRHKAIAREKEELLDSRKAVESCLVWLPVYVTLFTDACYLTAEG